jgi:hypothetical protein
VGYGVVERKGKYVCHGSTREKEATSTLQIYRLEKTMKPFRCGEPFVQYYDWSRDPEERANFSVSLVTDSLWR